MGPDPERMGMFDVRIAKMLQDIRLQDNASATAVHRRRGTLENIDVPANRTQRRGGEQPSQGTTNDQGLRNVCTLHYLSPRSLVIPTLRYANTG
ncbi:hypothetical protein FQZ97_1048960 [compost metagenome]